MIRALGGGEPHESWGGWENFLRSCEVRDEYDGVTFYGSVNCNYILFPNGLLIQNYGYHGRNVMADVRAKGAAQALADILRQACEYTEAAAELCAALDNLTNTLGEAFERSRKVQQAV